MIIFIDEYLGCCDALVNVRGEGHGQKSKVKSQKSKVKRVDQLSKIRRIGRAFFTFYF
jgi:hypothetical protein